MKHFGTVGERYCIAQQRNVPVEIWWDNDGNRLERCLNQGRCSYEKSYASRCDLRQDPFK